MAPAEWEAGIDGNEKEMEASSGPGSHRACVTFPHDKRGRLESIRVRKRKDRREAAAWIVGRRGEPANP